MSNSLSHSLPQPIKNARYTLRLGFRVSAGTPTDPTTPDTEYSTDGGATFSDCAEEITTGGGNGIGYLTLTGAEMNNTTVEIAAKSANCLTTMASITPTNLPILSSGTASAGAAGTLTLGTILAYDITGCYLRTTGGTGGGGTGGANNQARKITGYVTSTGVATVTPNWETTPDNTTTYDVLIPEGMACAALKALVPATLGRTLVVDSAGLADANMVKMGPTGSGTAQTARDIGASVLLSNGTSTGQVKLASGYVAMTWADIGSPTTVVNLSGTTIKTATDVETDTQGIQTVLNDVTATLAGLVVASGTVGGTGNDSTHVHLNGSLWVDDVPNGMLLVIYEDATSSTHSRWIEDYVAATDLATVDALPFTPSTSDTWQVISVRKDEDVAAIKTKTDYLPSATAGSAGGVFIAGSNAATTVNFTGSLSGSVGSVTGSVGSVVGAVGSVTGNVGGNILGTLTSTERNAIADAHIARNIAGGSSTGRNVGDVYAMIRNKWSISGTTLTVCETDDTTTRWTATVSTNASADPVTGSDPA